jgi:hypothetical protein
MRSVTLVAVAAATACSLMDLDDLSAGSDTAPDVENSDAGPPGAPTLVPQEGVYTFQDNLRSGADSGSEIVSINAGAATATAYDDPIFPGTVTHGSPGCWSILLEPVTTNTTQGHSELRSFCAVGGVLVDQSPATQVSRYTFGTATTTAVTEVSCGQNCLSLWQTPDAGSSSFHTCSGSTPVVSTDVQFASSGAYTFQDFEALQIGAQSMNAFHAAIHRVISPLDAQDGGLAISGTDDSDYYFDPTSGMLLRWKRTVSLTTAIPPFGTVDYEEHSDWLLTGMQPAPLPDGGLDASVDADASDAPIDAPSDTPKDAPKDTSGQ